jgi:hypothetical protein
LAHGSRAHPLAVLKTNIGPPAWQPSCYFSKNFYPVSWLLNQRRDMMCH